MTKRWKNIRNKLYPAVFLVLLLLAWSAVSFFGVVPRFMLPAPWEVVRAFVLDFPLLMEHSGTSLFEAFAGLFLSIAGAGSLAVLMDRWEFLHLSLYPMLVVTQTVPMIAIAPLLVLWFGYGMAPKIILIFVTCFFPLVVALLTGFASVDRDMLRLFHSMGASRRQILRHVKLPYAIPSFFSGLRIAAAYSVVGAIVAEWLGGTGGLGVYMTRVRKGYSYDRMFAVILLISVISLALIRLVGLLERAATPWNRTDRQ